MSIKYTPNTLKKVEQLLEESRFRVRYEKGTFTSGYCLLEDRQIAVINRFLNLEGRINALIEIVQQINIPIEDLSDEMKKFFQQIAPEKYQDTQNNLLNFDE